MKRKDDNNYYDTDESVSFEATKWISRIKSGQMTPEGWDKFRTWLAEDRAHITEIEMMSAIWDCSDVLKENPFVAQEAGWLKARRRGRGVMKWLLPFKTGMPILKPIAAVTVALLIVVGLWWDRTNEMAPISYQTAVAHQRAISLPDGSTVSLDTDTSITTHYTETIREINLVKGRALFAVVKDPDRPFIVKAGKVSIRAVGTEFNVYKKTDKVYVTVTEGQVKVIRKNGMMTSLKKDVHSIKTESAEKPLLAAVHEEQGVVAKLVGSGEEIVVSEKEPTYELRPVNIEKAKSWQSGRLIFHNTPLKEAIEEINRYLERKIQIRYRKYPREHCLQSQGPKTLSADT
ncbi:MAG: FecR domain-containing protein [Deltaproteobacteria bacterium]|nr:FecR domain-containing protein [Deltaproteobacteria bacterium]